MRQSNNSSKTQSRSSIGYGLIIDKINSANTVNELIKVIEQSIQLINEYNLDDYQSSKLKEIGEKRYFRIMNNQTYIERELSSNRKLK